MKKLILLSILVFLVIMGVGCKPTGEIGITNPTHEVDYNTIIFSRADTIHDLYGYEVEIIKGDNLGSFGVPCEIQIKRRTYIEYLVHKEFNDLRISTSGPHDRSFPEYCSGEFEVINVNNFFQ